MEAYGRGVMASDDAWNGSAYVDARAMQRIGFRLSEYLAGHRCCITLAERQES